MSQFVLNLDTYNAKTSAYAASLVCSHSAPVYLCGITVYNSSASSQFIQVHDAASLPANAAVPEFFFEILPSTSKMIEFLRPRKFAVGIVVCNSSTGPTKTIGSADCWFDVQIAKAV